MIPGKQLIKSCRLLLPATLFLLMLSACQQGRKMPEDMVAQVNDNYLLKEQLNYQTPKGLDKDVSLAMKKNILAKWVENEALYQAALREGYKETPRERFYIEQYGKSLLIQRYLDSKLNREYTISRQDIEAYYKMHKQEFVRDRDEVHLIHLLLEQKDNAIFKEIRQSNDLLSIVKKYYYNEKSTLERPNGDLGYVPVNILPESFVRILKRMKTGSTSQPIRTGQGYHFLQLLDWERAGSLRDLELVKSDIIIRLKQERRQAEQERLVRDAKSNVQIQTYLSKIHE